MERNRMALGAAAAILAFAGCASPPRSTEPPSIAVDAVPREIKAGMDQASVSEALGPPHRVSADSLRREVWTYENIPSDRIDTERSVGGGITVFAGGLSPSGSPESRRTLTLLIYYDDQKKVRDFAYNYSSP